MVTFSVNLGREPIKGGELELQNAETKERWIGLQPGRRGRVHLPGRSQPRAPRSAAARHGSPDDVRRVVLFGEQVRPPLGVAGPSPPWGHV